MPVAPQVWHYRQSIDYEMTNNRAILDYASRNREKLLYNIYQMGRNSIKNGNEDHWTITPDRIEALQAAAQAGTGSTSGRRGAAAGAAQPGAEAELPPGLSVGGLGARTSCLPICIKPFCMILRIVTRAVTSCPPTRPISSQPLSS